MLKETVNNVYKNSSFVYIIKSLIGSKNMRVSVKFCIAILYYCILTSTCVALPNLDEVKRLDPLDTIIKYISIPDKTYSDHDLFSVAQAFHNFGLSEEALKIYSTLNKSSKLSQSQVKECAISAAALRLQQGEFEATIDILNDPSLNFHASEVIPLHFKAFAYYYKNEINRARTLFEAIVSQGDVPTKIADEANFYLGIIKRDEDNLRQIKVDSDYFSRALLERLRLGNLAVLDDIEEMESGEAKYYQLVRNAKQKQINTSSYRRNRPRLEKITETAWRNLAYATLNQEVFTGLIKTLSNNESNHK